MNLRLVPLLALSLLSTGCATTVSSESAATATDVRDDRVLVTVQHDSLRGIADLSPSGRLAYLPPSSADVHAQQLERARKLATEFDIELEESWPIPALGVYCFVFRLPDPAARVSLLSALEAHPDVESAQPLNFFETRTEPLLDDGSGLGERLEVAHRVATGKSVTIAVIDAGADLDHEDLQGAAIRAIDLVDGRSAVPAEFHGTAVVGVIAARRNETGILGYAPDADILLLRACWQPEARVEQAICNSYTLAKALSLALESDASIVNLSISGPRDPLLERLALALLADGKLVVAAGASSDVFPASVPGSIRAWQSMPGDPRPAMSLLPGNRYGLRSGSSIVAARLSAVAALMKQVEPKLTAAQFHDRLLAAKMERHVLPVVELLQTGSTLDAKLDP